MRILKYMLQRSTLDQVFDALSDPTRRAIVERLVRGPASVSELAAPFPMSLSAVGQHLQQLEASGLVQSSKIGRVRTVRLIPETLSTAELWFEQHRTRWEQRFDRLGDLLAEEISQKTKPKSKRKKRHNDFFKTLSRSNVLTMRRPPKCFARSPMPRKSVVGSLKARASRS
jgi:DNA-binding transcriptional ArsR family regulator